MTRKSFKGSAADIFDTGADHFLTSTPKITSTKTTPKELIINPVFQALIPPLSNEEYAQLEENLRKNGIREAISIWGDTIVDGHNRYEIAAKYNLTYTTVSYEFECEDDVKLWIFKNQIGRRNLSPFERVRLALHLEPVFAERAKMQQIRKPMESVRQISAEQIPINTRNAIADISSVSHDTVSKVKKILDVGAPEILEKLQRGDLNYSVNKAYLESCSKERKENVPLSNDMKYSLSIPNSDFSVIYADPPWEPKFLNDQSDSSKSNSYTMKFGDLRKLGIPAADDAILLLWSYTSILDKALQLMNAWGFKYRTNIIWDKQQVELGQYVRGQHEMLLIGIKGNFNPPAEDVRVASVYSEESGKQKTKPKWFYEQIEKMFPNEKYLELFASNKHNDRWTVFDNRVKSKEVNAK